ncbi:MAG: hypothetical protein E6I02_10005 [Chloroflexi bacterium]|jgi:hypothetical protein|nr:MAG: hypothetical protein E6I09_05280 [Chloroflexota bacterium]TMG05424.1 MAG: hypothetical protein E6I02_10005 [Chloroflexota bacterium]
MRPTAIESLRAAQAALAELIAPELASAFALDAAQTVQMLLESLASEWDTAAETLSRDNETLSSLLSASGEALTGAPSRNESVAPIVSQIERLRDDRASSLVLSDLASRNGSLRAALESVLVAFEELTGRPGSEMIDEVRNRIYNHLREEAARGWSFWDVSSFRGRMAALQPPPS